MSLKLKGIFSYVDKFGRLKFVFIDDVDETDETRKKLTNTCRADTKPFDETEFTVCMPKSGRKTAQNHGLPEDINDLIGRRVTVWVKVSSYSFVSQLEKNKGERVRGVQLILEKIEPI
jgi:hypothetical protein